MDFLNEILLRRKNKVVLRHASDNNLCGIKEKVLIVTIAKNIESFGFTFEKEVYGVLMKCTEQEIKDFGVSLISELKKLIGADKKYNPMYPNFPQQVAESSEAALFINAMIHYWSFGEWLPDYEKSERMPLLDSIELTPIGVGTEEDVCKIFKNLVGSKTNLSWQDKTDIINFINNFVDFYKYLPEEIPLKENIALIGKTILEKDGYSVHSIERYFKTATDVLRLVVALSDGDISLANNTKFKKLKRSERKSIMILLANCKNLTEDMFKYKNQWIRIGEIIHPFTFKEEKYKGVIKAFNSIRNQKKPEFLLAKVQRLLAIGDTTYAAFLLKSRPGDFARQLDKFLRDSNDKNQIISYFKEIVDEVSTPVLLQVFQHFKTRNDKKDVRTFFLKGNVSNIITIENNLPLIDNDICNQVAAICAESLAKRFSTKNKLGKVYIDEDLKGFLVPFNQRSASNSNKSLVRGSHISLSEKTKFIRSFVWWTNTKNNDRVDIDLSATIYRENWNYIEHISYTNLQSSLSERACHSGDIINGGKPDGNGVSEFIDIDIDATVDFGGRYIVFQVYNFTHQNFSSLKNCRFGWMNRQDIDSGEIFEPSTVDTLINITSDTKGIVPVIFDCVNKEFIWCDVAINPKSGYSNNFENNSKKLLEICRGIINLNKPNLYDLIYLNSILRDEIVEQKNKADVIFSNNKTIPTEIVMIEDESGNITWKTKEKNNVKIITAYDIDYIMNQLL